MRDRIAQKQTFDAPPVFCSNDLQVVTALDNASGAYTVAKKKGHLRVLHLLREKMTWVSMKEMTAELKLSDCCISSHLRKLERRKLVESREWFSCKKYWRCKR